MKNWFDSLNEIVLFIENNLEEEISYDELGKMMGYSTYHLQRLFLMVAGVSLSEYIRCRRLSKAAQELISHNSKITDLAYNYGYSSPTSFNRAFKAFHGVTPKELKKNSVLIKAYPPLSFELSIKGASSLDYRIVHTEAFKIVGKKLPTTMENGASYKELPAFWQQVQQSGEIPDILALMNTEPLGLLGVSDYNPNLKKSEFDYYIAVATTAPTPDNYEELIIPAATWAAFPHRMASPKEMQKFQHQIVMDWLPSSGYQFAFGPDLEVYGQDNSLETWIPVTGN
ncbi:AraC family transcriptional regulator [uncultured Enterococcus sp.]|uniref:AraC family transcriptional regulator n=1 Tax=uncultured Enterococcus sp. TaxID=167972 RepID=UPI002AA79DB4|nr:AraC family transcriptional regulator [uncultured Enterococcus sp.]